MQRNLDEILFELISEIQKDLSNSKGYTVSTIYAEKS